MNKTVTLFTFVFATHRVICACVSRSAESRWRAPCWSQRYRCRWVHVRCTAAGFVTTTTTRWRHDEPSAQKGVQWQGCRTGDGSVMCDKLYCVSAWVSAPSIGIDKTKKWGVFQPPYPLPPEKSGKYQDQKYLKYLPQDKFNATFLTTIDTNTLDLVFFALKT